jgi:hypothetical protein
MLGAEVPLLLADVQPSPVTLAVEPGPARLGAVAGIRCAACTRWGRR